MKFYWNCNKDALTGTVFNQIQSICFVFLTGIELDVIYVIAQTVMWTVVFGGILCPQIQALKLHTWLKISSSELAVGHACTLCLKTRCLYLWARWLAWLQYCCAVLKYIYNIYANLLESWHRFIHKAFFTMTQSVQCNVQNWKLVLVDTSDEGWKHSWYWLLTATEVKFSWRLQELHICCAQANRYHECFT